MSATLNPYKRRPKLSVKDPAWRLGDIVKEGSKRWAIRVLNGKHVELEIMNSSPRVWWTTTLDQLPTKTANR